MTKERDLPEEGQADAGQQAAGDPDAGTPDDAAPNARHEPQGSDTVRRPNEPDSPDAGSSQPTQAMSPAELQAELAAAQMRELRAMAELENFRKRMRREMEDERRYAAVPLTADLLTVLDNLYRAIEAAEKNQGGQGLLEGVKMVTQQFEQVLRQHHCQVIAAEGQPFDPNVHEALAQIPSAEVEPGTVLQVARTGYRLHDRVIRPAQVLVASRPVETNT